MKFWPSAKPRRSKFNAQAETTGGKRFASKKEAARYRQLYMLERAGCIRDLRTQVRWPILVNGHLICTYVADFTFKTADGETVVEDVKSSATITPVYKIKRSLMLALHGVVIKET